VEGQSVHFTTEAIGVPVPMLSWQRDGRMLSDADDGGRYRIQTDGGRSSLQITAAKPEDSAWFQCTAASVSGMASNRAKLVVQGSVIIIIVYLIYNAFGIIIPEGREIE
jgi:Immunoglobulin I-set domain